jgi:hypothetical protein
MFRDVSLFLSIVVNLPTSSKINLDKVVNKRSYLHIFRSYIFLSFPHLAHSRNLNLIHQSLIGYTYPSRLTSITQIKSIIKKASKQDFFGALFLLLRMNMLLAKSNGIVK